MVSFSAIVAQLLELRRLRYFFLVSLKGTDHYTTAPYDLQMDNGAIYLCNAGLQSVEPPRISSTVDRASYKVSFADVQFLLKSYFETGATGDTVEVRIGFYNTLGVTISGVLPDAPFTQMANTVVMYKGVVDGQFYEIDLAGGEAIAVIEGSSPMADLDLVRTLYTNNDSMRQLNAADTSFDKVYEGSGEIQLKWGKA
jgi:hypothetical protein